MRCSQSISGYPLNQTHNLQPPPPPLHPRRTDEERKKRTCPFRGLCHQTRARRKGEGEGEGGTGVHSLEDGVASGSLPAAAMAWPRRGRRRPRQRQRAAACGACVSSVAGGVETVVILV